MINPSSLSEETKHKPNNYVPSTVHSFQILQTPSIQNNNSALIDRALSIKSTEKIEECSSISPNLDDDIYHNRFDVKEIHDLLSIILSKITTITSLNPETKFNLSSHELFNHKLKELLLDLNTSITTQINNVFIKNEHININELYFIKKHIKQKCINTIKKQLQQQQGLRYCRHISLSSIQDFLSYYSSLTPLELNDKASIAIDDSLQNTYIYYFGHNYDTNKDNGKMLISFLNKMSSLYNININKRRIHLNISGKIKIVNEDEIIIELGEIIPYLTANVNNKTKTKIILIHKLLFEIIIRQFPFISQINFFCNIYYAKKSHDYVIVSNTHYEENIVFTYINIQ